MGIVEVHLKNGCIYGVSLNYEYPLYDVNIDKKNRLLTIRNTITELNVLILPLEELKYVILREEVSDV